MALSWAGVLWPLRLSYSGGILAVFSVMVRFAYFELSALSLGRETPTSAVPGDLQGQGVG